MAKKGFLDGYKTYDDSNGFGNPTTWHQAFRERMTKDDAAILLRDSKDTPHNILSVNKNASQLTIKKAFRNKIAEWHPDRNPHRIEEAVEQSKRIIAAYTLLKAK